MKRIFIIPVLIVIAQTLFAQQQILRPDGKSISKIEIDSISQHLMDNAGATGLSLGIINDNIAYVKSYGYRNKSTNQLNDTATC